MARLLKEYNEDLRPKIQKILGLKNPMEIPKVTKITLNMGVGEAVADKKILDNALKDMETIAGQKPIKTLAKKSVAGFKIRDGMPVGLSVTLRNERMYDFLARLIHIVLPRIRDFRGISPNGFDGRGNYSLGLKDQLIFPEISYDDVAQLRGFDITIVTTAKTDEEALALLKGLGMPLAAS